ncbi:hypothetical protein MTX78_20465 [Hymenobacter tibetensis]|uniref:Uncharacterized protein n=1 Tax=Hymenobacter tibetensis TaxID=497967 RepID=A0ABY4CW32_9BACT|nr:DUF6624 domain-containing protein [Hymenobacter tibetensis]UOG74481.1 hypothetical protein MTX78_20465 [Hymenobacter tibetensis]
MHYIRYVLFLVGLLPSLSASAQTPLNWPLKWELDRIDAADQYYRELLLGVPGIRPRYESLTGISWLMTATDSVHIQRIAQLIKQYGYPGRTLVGSPTNEVALLVIQHSSRIPQYLPLIKRMADQGEVSFATYARMLDRHLMQQGKMQLYGTQGCGYTVPSPTTGKPEQVSFIWPIEDATHVNERRKKAGFDSTVEENAQRLGIEYKPLTMAEVQRIEQAARGTQH